MARLLPVECPSGLIVTVREFTVADEDLLADPKSQRQGAAITELITAICHNVGDPGPYQSISEVEGEGGSRINWADVLMGDRMTVLLMNRIFTWGSEFAFKQPCVNCRAQVETEIDLTKLKIKPLPESSRAHVIDPEQNPLSVRLPNSEVKVSFRLLRGRDDKALKRLQKQQKKNLSSAYLRYRVTDIENVPQPDWTTWLRRLGGQDSSYLRDAFDEADCGVDQEIEFECAECDHVWNDDIRFRADFLFPKYRKKTQTRGS